MLTSSKNLFLPKKNKTMDYPPKTFVELQKPLNLQTSKTQQKNALPKKKKKEEELKLDPPF